MKLSHQILFSVFLFLFTFGSVSSGYGNKNSKLDSLLIQRWLLNLSIVQEDTAKVDILIKLAEKTSWSDIKSSEKYIRLALDISQKANYTKGLAYSKYNLAALFADFEFDFTENLILQSLDHAKELNDSILIADIYNLLGGLKTSLNYNEEAQDYYNKSLGIYLRHTQDSSAAAIYNNLGIIYGEMFKDSIAISYYLKAAEINKRTKNNLWLSINHMNIGYELMKLENLEEAYKQLNRSLNIAEKNNYTRLYPWIYNNFCSYYSEVNDFPEAISFANKTLKIAKDIKNYKLQAEALTKLKDIYFQSSELDKAFYYQEQLSIVKDTVNKHSSLRELDMLELRFKFEEERKQEKLKNELQQAKHYRKELAYIFILLGTGLLLIIFILLYFVLKSRVKRKVLEKEKLSQELEFRNKELTTNVMYSIEKNNTLTVISEELFRIEKEAVKEETQNAIQRISKQIQASTDSQVWDEFETRFQQVHKDFYISLLKEYPNLTPNEKRLCGFLRLDLSSKEMSKLTGQSVSSLELARYRLRKKLGISNTNTNLNAFLNQF